MDIHKHKSSSPSCFILLRSWRNPLNGATPVPGPIMIMGVWGRAGNLGHGMIEKLTPWLNQFRINCNTLPKLGFSDENWGKMRWLTFSRFLDSEPTRSDAFIVASGGRGVFDQHGSHVNAFRIHLIWIIAIKTIERNVVSFSVGCRSPWMMMRWNSSEPGDESATRTPNPAEVCMRADLPGYATSFDCPAGPIADKVPCPRG